MPAKTRPIAGKKFNRVTNLVVMEACGITTRNRSRNAGLPSKIDSKVVERVGNGGSIDLAEPETTPETRHRSGLYDVAEQLSGRMAAAARHFVSSAL